MAERFGLDPFDIMQRWPQRYGKIARMWIKHQNDKSWNKPSRTDYYLMRVAQRVHQSSVSKREITLDDERVRFTDHSPEDQAKRVEQSKARWFAFTGFNPESKDPLKGTQHGDGT